MVGIDKMMGGIYGLFGFGLVFMGVGMVVMVYVKSGGLGEMWEGFGRK